MTKKFSVIVRYKDGRISEPQIVNSVEAIVNNLRIMKEGDTFQITRLKFQTLKELRQAKALRDKIRR